MIRVDVSHLPGQSLRTSRSTGERSYESEEDTDAAQHTGAVLNAEELRRSVGRDAVLVATRGCCVSSVVRREVLRNGNQASPTQTDKLVASGRPAQHERGGRSMRSCSAGWSTPACSAKTRPATGRQSSFASEAPSSHWDTITRDVTGDSGASGIVGNL